jgi:hypothetical protein
MLTGRAKSFQFFLILGNSSNLIFDKSKTMSDEEILKTEKNLIDFLMPIFFWMRLHFCRSSDFSQFAKKAISTSFPSKENLSQFCRKNKSSLASSASYSYVWKASSVQKRLKSRKTFYS